MSFVSKCLLNVQELSCSWLSGFWSPHLTLTLLSIRSKYSQMSINLHNSCLMMALRIVCTTLHLFSQWFYGDYRKFCSLISTWVSSHFKSSLCASKQIDLEHNSPLCSQDVPQMIKTILEIERQQLNLLYHKPLGLSSFNFTLIAIKLSTRDNNTRWSRANIINKEWSSGWLITASQRAWNVPSMQTGRDIDTKSTHTYAQKKIQM